MSPTECGRRGKKSIRIALEEDPSSLAKYYFCRAHQTEPSFPPSRFLSFHQQQLLFLFLFIVLVKLHHNSIMSSTTSKATSTIWFLNPTDPLRFASHWSLPFTNSAFILLLSDFRFTSHFPFLSLHSAFRCIIVCRCGVVHELNSTVFSFSIETYLLLHFWCFFFWDLKSKYSRNWGGVLSC